MKKINNKNIFIVFLFLILIFNLIGCDKKNNETYKSESLNLEIFFPEEWNGKYLLEEDETGITVYHTKTYQNYANFGVLFILRKAEGGADVYNENTNPGGNYIISQTEEYTYLMLIPTDVQCDINDPNEYLEIAEQIGEIRENIKFIK